MIDGQQRLTTLQVLLAAFRDVVAETGENTFLEGELERLTVNTGQYSSEDDEFKVWPTTAFQSDFQTTIKAGSVTQLEAPYPGRWYRGKFNPPRPALAECYLFFAKKLREYLLWDSQGEESTSEESGASADWLYHALSAYLQLVVIELGAEDDPQVIFETLNGKGVPLGPADLVRNFLFLTAARKRQPTAELYETYWQAFDEPGVPTRQKFWMQEERQGRFKRKRLDLFLFHYVRSRAAHDLKLEHLYQEFRDWWAADTSRSLEVEMAAIRRYADVYRSFLHPNRADPWGQLAERLSIPDTATVYPLLLWLIDNRDGAVDFEGMLLDIESYLVRRTICGLTPKNYNRVFLQILERLTSAGAPTRDALQHELLSLHGDSGIWPDDQTFRAAILERPVYRDLGPRKTQMILRALNDVLHTRFQEDVQVGSGLTVEHILPQSASISDWPYPPQIEGDEVGLQWTRRYGAIDTFGNLTLLTQPLNSSVGRGPFSGKRGRIAEQSLLALNRYFQRFADEDVWDERAIRQRGEVLARLALEVWPRPSN